MYSLPESPRAKTRVFFVDDDAETRELLRFLLGTTKEYEEAGSASKVEGLLEAVRQSSPDVLLMDLTLDGENPVEFIRALHAACPRVRIILLTGSSDAELLARARGAGACGHISKTTEILDALAKALAANAAHQPPREPEPEDLAATVRRTADRLGIKRSDPWLTGFLARTESDFAGLRNAAVHGNRRSLGDIAHKFAGLSGMIGGVQVSRSCLELEALAASDSSAQAIATILDRLETELGSLRAAVVAFMRDDAGELA